MMKKKIVVFGSFIADLMARTPHLPVPGETVKGESFKIGPGGKGSNQAIAAKRAGGDVTFISKIGKDVFGQLALETYKKEKMDTKYMFEDKQLSTGTALITVDSNTSENEIVVISGACGNITDTEIEMVTEEIKNCDIFVTQLETNKDALEKVISIASENNIQVVLNPAPVQLISDSILKLIDIITPNEVEAGEFTGVKIKTMEDVKKAACILQQKGIDNVVITLGSKGVYVKTLKKDEFIKAYRVKAVDTTGAGDAFNGGFVAALSHGKDIFEATKYGNAVAALSVTKLGTAPSMPYMEDIEKFMRENS
ncbi:ribokinase [Clostridium niameyense]|uniref:ribokinase n=1 Tax=Clostridium niameyense TaxID=1622073 RepID=UPI000A916DED